MRFNKWAWTRGGVGHIFLRGYLGHDGRTFGQPWHHIVRCLRRRWSGTSSSDLFEWFREDSFSCVVPWNPRTRSTPEVNLNWQRFPFRISIAQSAVITYLYVLLFMVGWRKPLIVYCRSWMCSTITWSTRWLRWKTTWRTCMRSWTCWSERV